MMIRRKRNSTCTSTIPAFSVVQALQSRMKILYMFWTKCGPSLEQWPMYSITKSIRMLLSPTGAMLRRKLLCIAWEITASFVWLLQKSKRTWTLKIKPFSTKCFSVDSTELVDLSCHLGQIPEENSFNAEAGSFTCRWIRSYWHLFSVE